MDDDCFVTDGGLETDLIFLQGEELPDFAAFPLLDGARGRALLTAYFAGYAAVARAATAPLLLETPTWRANPDWGARLGYAPPDLARIDRDAVAFLRGLAETYDLPVVEVGGTIGPRGDGYVPGAAVDPAEAAAYHRPQLQAFANAGASRVTAYTLTDVGEATGIALAAQDLEIPVGIGFTVETDGRLPDGTTVAAAIAAVDAVATPATYLVNCAHPDHVARALDAGHDGAGGGDGAWRTRIGGLRVNASTKSHAELDEATELDAGDPVALAAGQRRLVAALPAIRVLGGCCGTDVRHVAAMWDVAPPAR